MQSAVNIGESDIQLIPANDLREMTISKEALFERQKDSVIDSLMSTIIKLATEQGGTNYVANLNPQFPTELLTEIVKTFEDLGYKTSVQELEDPKMGKFSCLTLNWE